MDRPAGGHLATGRARYRPGRPTLRTHLGIRRGPMVGVRCRPTAVFRWSGQPTGRCQWWQLARVGATRSICRRLDPSPDLCLYEQGECPASGRYQISQAGGHVQIAIAWRTQDGSEHEVKFASPNDGSRTDSSAPGTSHLSITRVSESILDSRAFLADREIAYARRSASIDGQLLSTVQVGYRPDGSSFRNFQVYRRDESR